MSDEYSDAGSTEAMVIDVNTAGAVEMGPVPSGEYKLQCIKAEMKGGTNKKGNPWQGISVLFDIPDEITAGLVNHMEFVPLGGGTEKQNAQGIGKFSKFKAGFGFGEAETFTASDLVGREVWATLSLKDDPEYGPQNKIQSFIPSQG